MTRTRIKTTRTTTTTRTKATMIRMAKTKTIKTTATTTTSSTTTRITRIRTTNEMISQATNPDLDPGKHPLAGKHSKPPSMKIRKHIVRVNQLINISFNEQMETRLLHFPQKQPK